MTRSDWKDTFEAIGVFAIVASLIFVAFEIRTNTASNLFEKGLAGEDMTRAEARQFNGLVSMYLTQSFHMLRLYDQGLVTEDEARSAFRVLRRRAQQGHFKSEIEGLSNERRRRLILDPDGLEKCLNQDC
jgi:hypothetical protein